MIDPLLRWLGRLSVIFWISCLSCAADPPRPRTYAQTVGTAASTIVIAPLNIALPLPEKLEDSTQLVSAALVDYVESHNKAAVVLGSRRGYQLWIESMAEVRSSGTASSFENAARVLARRIGQTTDFDALILPSVFVQNAKIDEKGTAYWDGAKQKIEFKGQSKWEVEMTPLSTISAASLLIYVFDRNGQKIHSKRTGLELIQHMAIQTRKRKGHDKRSWVVKNDSTSIEDTTRITAAIAHSLSPFLPKATR